MEALYLFCLAVLVVTCTLGVLHPRYEDTLLQRLGMAVACLGAFAELAGEWLASDRHNAHLLTIAGVALFAVGTVWKKVRAPRMGRRATDQPKRRR